MKETKAEKLAFCAEMQRIAKWIDRFLIPRTVKLKNGNIHYYE